MDLTALKNAIEAYTQNNDWTGPVGTVSGDIISSQLDVIIKQAENKIYSIVKAPSATKKIEDDAIASATGAMSTTISDFQKPISAVLKSTDTDAEGWNRLLLYKGPGFSGSWGNTNTTIFPLSIPKYYSVTPSILGSGEPVQLTVFPFPSVATFTLDLTFYGFPTSIVDESDGKSWLGETAENLLLYGCLVEAYTFMKGDMDLLQGYKQKFDEAVQAFNQTTLYSWDQKR